MTAPETETAPTPGLEPRLMAWYAGAVGALGMLPFLAPHLADAGFSDAAATALLMLLPLGTLLGGPLWSWWVDRSGQARRTLTAALVVTALSVVALVPASGWLVVPAIAVFATFRATIFPLGDALTVQRLGPRYGTVRAVGSLTYIGVVLSAGVLRDVWAPFPLAVAAAALFVTALVSAGLPEIPVVERPSRSDWVALVRTPTVRALLLVAFLNGLSLTTYDHLFTLHMDRTGVPGWLTGGAVAWGVAVEVCVLFAGSRLLHRFGATPLLVLAAAAGIPRFGLTALAIDSPWIVAACQGLHGVQFGAFWVAAVHHMSTLAPRNLARSAQALLPATGFGLATLCSLGVSATWLSFGTTRGLFAALLLPTTLATLAALRLHRMR